MVTVEYKGRKFYYGDADDPPEAVWFCNSPEQTMVALYPHIAWKTFYTDADDDGNYNCSIVGYNEKYLLKTFKFNTNTDEWYLGDSDYFVEMLEETEELKEFENRESLLKYSRRHNLGIEI